MCTSAAASRRSPLGQHVDFVSVVARERERFGVYAHTMASWLARSRCAIGGHDDEASRRGPYGAQLCRSSSLAPRCRARFGTPDRRRAATACAGG
jgi:hypothetical protein